MSELLDVDRGYRDKAATGQLQQITPRRFNPSGEAWLPILHTPRAPTLAGRDDECLVAYHGRMKRFIEAEATASI